MGGAWDVIVVGGGGGGLAAAVSAGRTGARVLLLEKAAHVGGTTALAIGSIAAAGTSMQRAAHVADSADLHFADVEAVVRGRPGQENVRLRRLLVVEAAATVEWLHGLGVEFYGPNPWPGMSAPRMHNALPNARAYVEVLGRAARRLGVEIRTGARATALVTDESGTVIGVRIGGDPTAVGPESPGSGEIVLARAVVVATGYFHGDPDLRARYLPPDAAPVDSIDPNQTGDGHRMTMALGAPMVNMGVGSAPEFRFVTRTDRLLARRLPVHPLATRAMRLGLRMLPRAVFLRVVKDLITGYTAPSPKLFAGGGILVNRDGTRFANELGDFTYAVARQPGKVGYLVFDDDVARTFSAYPNVVSTAPGIAYAYLTDYRQLRPDIYHVAPTVERAAVAAGLPPDAVAATVALWNRAIAEGAMDPFGRTDLGVGIRQPPFHVMGPAKSWFVDSQGGPAVDEQCRVLGGDGGPIRGLFAAGALSKASLLYGGAGFDLAWVFTSGRIAGAAAAVAARAGSTGSASRPSSTSHSHPSEPADARSGGQRR